MMRKRAVKFLIAMVALAGLSVPVLAQSTPQEQSPSQEQPQHRHWKGQMHSVDDRVQHMTKALNLSTDQQAKVKSILQDQQKQMASLKEDKSMSQQDRHAKFQQIRQDTKDKIGGVLTDEQKAQWEKMRADRMHRMDKGAGSSQKQ